MDTKLKVNFYGIGFKFLAFVLLLAGVLMTVTSWTNFEDVVIYLGGHQNARSFLDGMQNDIRNTTSQELYNNLNYLYFIKDANLTSTEKELYKEKVKAISDKGFRFFFVSNDKIVLDDGKMPKITADEIYNSIILSFSGDTEKLSYNSQEGTLYITLSNEYFTAMEKEIQPKADNGRVMFYSALAGIALVLIGIIMLALLAGKKNRNSEVQIKFYDKIYTDVFLSIYILCGGGIIAFVGWIWVELETRGLPIEKEAIQALTYFAAAIFAVLTAWVTTSFFKRVKSGEVIKYSLIYKAFDLILRFSRKVLNRFKRCFTVAVKPFITLANKTIKRKYIFSGVLLTAILYFNAIILMVMGVTNNFILVFLWLVFTIPFIAILVVVFCLSQMEEFEAIKKGSGQIRKGNLLYKIPPCKNAEINQVAEDINNIGDGLNAAVRNAISSEKLKTELITNVSHDLKTPLTSIIEYINLISQEDGLSPEVKDYLGVLKNKSERLNNIISDLFDLSKSASGNSELIIEKLDLKKLVVQTLADMDDKVVNSGHVVKQSLPETEVFINADGKKLYRVFQNVIDNALKYALEGTRIFIDLKVVGLKAIVEIHNTASYEMDFTEQEILERFTRGDKSRTTDGTGLGLSIAETFTKACGGDFNIKIDGDQFRVIIEFNIL